MTVFNWLYFSHPSFLLLIPLVLFLFVLKYHNKVEHQQLTDFIDSKLLSHLQTSSIGQSLPSWVGVLVSCLFIIGISGISWEKAQSKTFISPQQSIIILDQSLSMYATDIKPNRLTRLKQKVRDLLAEIKEGNIAITAYAGDAYVISPFSQDKSTLTHFLLALDPMIMPLYGSDLVAAFKTSLALIKNPAQETHLILFTDDVKKADIMQIEELVSHYNLVINIISIGTLEGSTIQLPSGQLLQSTQGVVQVSLPEPQLKELATKLSAKYFDSSLTDQDIKHIASATSSLNTGFEEAKNNALQWVEKGHWFAFPFLLWLLYQFRSGVLFSLFLLTIFTKAPNVQASPLEWFSTPDQQAQKLADQGNWQDAKELFQNKEWQAASEYALGDYKNAANLLESLSRTTNSAEFFYNKGNSLALSGKLETSIQAYKQAISLKREFSEAKENLTYIEKLLEQQQEEQEEQNQNKSDKNSSSKENKDQDKDSSSEKNSQNQNNSRNDVDTNEQQTADEIEQKDDQKKPEQAGEAQKPSINTDSELSQEDKIALDQWMRQIQDDPGGLLKRKLWYLHREKRAENSYRQQDGLPIW